MVTCCLFYRCLPGLCILGELHIKYQNVIFYWNILALQYCVSLCCTMKWISKTYTHSSSVWGLPPSSACHFDVWSFVWKMHPTPNRRNSSQGFLRLYFPGYDPQFGSNKIPFLPLNLIVNLIFIDSLKFIHWCIYSKSLDGGGSL